MAVYVDQERNKVSRMLMCHMIADTVDELNEMADRIGLERKWVQKSNGGMVHYDICQSKRDLAIQNGAIEVDRRKFVELMRRMT
jgi:hypothetical protein